MSNVAYGVSHAAIDRLVADIGHELRPHGVTAVALCPLGHVEDKVHDPHGQFRIGAGAAYTVELLVDWRH